MSSKSNVLQQGPEQDFTSLSMKEQRLQAIQAFHEAWWEQRCQEWRERGRLGEPGPVITTSPTNKTT
ncbi:hypothetical protein [Serratia sp. OS31]|uniref:hypothetical protein n=1 Tax=Serratia sp. OS31 TaxID=2760844 RepID=UPI0016036E24|nr:hypothetical protein [Serratia sp. OS31]MBB1580637.1 hypothetical protein [Serratia sp. OS31]